MNEEHAVLNFFSQAENLPLALSVAEQVDTTRQQLNQAFWKSLTVRMSAYAPEWSIGFTEDRNASDCLVGLHLEPAQKQTFYLRPMLEQQYLGEVLRIYFGLMWNAPPTPDLMRLDPIIKLRDALQQTGFKNNEKFLAWQWTTYYPRRKDFLLRFSSDANSLLDEITELMNTLLVTHSTALHGANTALRDAPRSAAISLAQLRTTR